MSVFSRFFAGLREDLRPPKLLAALVSLPIIVIAYQISFETFPRPLWYDEANIAHLISEPWSALVRENALRNSAPPLFAAFQKAFFESTFIINGVPIGGKEYQFIWPEILKGAFHFPSIMMGLTACTMACFLSGVPGRTVLNVLVGLLLAFSPGQVMYAHQGREYIAASLLTVLLLYSWHRLYLPEENRRVTLAALGLLLFLAPNLQYGLALLCAGLLAGHFAESLWRRDRAGVRNALLGGVLLGAGAGLTWWLALSKQYQAARGAAYLARQYWPESGLPLPSYLASNTQDMWELAFGRGWPGMLALALALPGAWRVARRPGGWAILAVWPPLLLAGLLGVYPFGGVRQCLAWLPVAVLLSAEGLLFLAECLRDTLRRIAGQERLAEVGFVLGALALAGPLLVGQAQATQAYLRRPPPENMPKLLRAMKWEVYDDIFVFPQAVPAFRLYYGEERDGPIGNVRFGSRKTEVLNRQLGEMLAAKQEHNVWLVMTHVSRANAEQVARQLSQLRRIEPVYIGNGAFLYVAPPVRR